MLKSKLITNKYKIKPNWEIVLNAIILFKSFWTKPQVAANKAVEAPIKVITNNAVELYSNKGEDLTNKYKPAVTSVAAWSKALTGVGNLCSYLVQIKKE